MKTYPWTAAVPFEIIWRGGIEFLSTWTCYDSASKLGEMTIYLIWKLEYAITNSRVRKQIWKYPTSNKLIWCKDTCRWSAFSTLQYKFTIFLVICLFRTTILLNMPQLVNCKRSRREGWPKSCSSETFYLTFYSLGRVVWQ